MGVGVECPPHQNRATSGALTGDGASTPLGPYLIEKTVRPAALQHFSEVPVALLDAAGKTGRYDDMTVVVLRIIRC